MEKDKQPEYYAYFDRCKGQEEMPPVQIGMADSEERKKYFKEYGFTKITKESFGNHKGLGILVVQAIKKL